MSKSLRQKLDAIFEWRRGPRRVPNGGREWNKQPGSITRAIIINGGTFIDDTSEPFPVPLQGIIPQNPNASTGELTINYTSTGYHDPGNMYGGPDQLGYPPEGSDERTIVGATYQAYNDNDASDIPEVKINPAHFAVLDKIYGNHIADGPVSEPDDYGPEEPADMY